MARPGLFQQLDALIVFLGRHCGRREVDPYRHEHGPLSCDSTPPDWPVAPFIVVQIPRTRTAGRKGKGVRRTVSWRHLGEQHKLQNFCQNLREEYLKRRRTVRSVRVESPAELNRLERPLEEQSFYQNRFGALRLRRPIVSAQLDSQRLPSRGNQSGIRESRQG